MIELNLHKNIIDNELLENQADATQNLETEDASTLKDNEAKGKSLEEEINRALKLLKLKKLSKDDYQKLFNKAFVDASSLLRADLKLAEKFKNLPTADGFRSDKYKLKGGKTATKTKAKILEVEYGLKYQQAWEIQQIDEKFVKETIEEARKKDELPTRRLALKILRKQHIAKNKANKMEERRKSFASIHSSEAIKLDGDKYNIIYANPIYKSETSDKQLAVSTEDMKKMQIPADDNAVLFLWTNAKELINSLEIVNAWGFTYRDQAVWDFEKVNTANLCFESRHKILLVATKGDKLPKPALTKTSVFRERSDKTDLKPAYYYETIARMFPEGAYLDVFAKEPFNSKWTTFYNNNAEVKNDETN